MKKQTQTVSVFNVHSTYNSLNIFIMKNLKNLGKALSKAEQKEVNGGSRPSQPTICAPLPSFVVCYSPKTCTLGANGWYCA